MNDQIKLYCSHIEENMKIDHASGATQAEQQDKNR